MFDFIKKINESVNGVFFNMLITWLVSSTFIAVNHMYLIVKFSEDHKQIATQIYKSLKENKQHTFISDNKIHVAMIDKKGNHRFLELKNRRFSKIKNNTRFSQVSQYDIRFTIDENIAFKFPDCIAYNFDDIIVSIDGSHISEFSLNLFIFLVIALIFIQTLTAMKLKKDASNMRNLKISAQEYALSQRTTSFLVNIMHHKLNSPLKVLSTKSRKLITTIEDFKNITPTVVNRSGWDYKQLEGSLKTIFDVTRKLKSYNELSKSESNIYKLFRLSKETIEILKDDEFELENDYKNKLYDIDKNAISSHEIIQIFINQIKFSLFQLADKISITVFSEARNSITILYSDNGNQIDDELKTLIYNNTNVSDLSVDELSTDKFDQLLNFNIINSNDYTSIKIIHSNENGNVYKIKLPIVRNLIFTKRTY
jgi:hypothetical protein